MHSQPSTPAIDQDSRPVPRLYCQVVGPVRARKRVSAENSALIC